jgi:hypothetical protein
MFLPEDRRVSEPIHEPICPSCGLSVCLETAKTDEYGRATHEHCYLLKVQLQMRVFNCADQEIEQELFF